MIYTLPEWEERFIVDSEDDEGENWKFKASLAAAKSLYEKWRELYELVMAFTDTLPDEDDPISTRELIYQNAMMVAPKILSAAGDTLYIIKMENASIIRTNCMQLMVQVIFSTMMNTAARHHEQVIRDSMDEFKSLFREWTTTFVKDECDDEWGLF